jgi:hypothetical protein
MQQFPNHPPLYRCLAACYAHMGRLDEAREVIARLRAITPVVVPSIMPYRNPERSFGIASARRRLMACAAPINMKCRPTWDAWAEAQRGFDMLDRAIRFPSPQPEIGADVPATREARVER